MSKSILPLCAACMPGTYGRPEQGVGFPTTRMVVSHMWVMGNEPGVSSKAASALDHRAFSPTSVSGGF